MFAQSVQGLADRIDLTLEGFQSDHEIWLAARDLVVAAGTIPKGTVAATTWRVCMVWPQASDASPMRSIGSWTRPIPPSSAGRIGRLRSTGCRDFGWPWIWWTPLRGRSDTKPEQFAVAAMVIDAIPRVVAAPPGLMRSLDGFPGCPLTQVM